ncbi:MAG: hypothetical protein KDH92_12470, partial [Chloroflexi bacterium]|nr:hypothetical protein [Chloroflexota bacterium]
GLPAALPDGLAQSGTWRSVAVEGATCGRGAPYTFYLNESAAANAGIVILLDGGGACLKEGPAPAGTTGIARSLHCMDFENFEDPLMNDSLFTGLLASIIVPQVLPIFSRGPENPLRDDHFVALPYCTGDVFAGTMRQAYDYDPSEARFDVVHRGHLNVLGVLAWLYRNYPEDRPVLLTGLSAGGFGAIYNFPDVIERWPRSTLLPDSGIAPPIDDSLLAREGARVAARWGADTLIPYYCKAADCLSSSYRLLAAHAAQYDGSPADWRPFGLLQGQQDGTLTAYLETTACSYQQGLRRGRGEARPENLRAYLPATDKHVFSAINPLAGETPFVSRRGLRFLDWFMQLASAAAPSDLPADAIDPWLPCNPTFLPLGLVGGAR